MTGPHSRTAIGDRPAQGPRTRRSRGRHRRVALLGVLVTATVGGMLPSTALRASAEPAEDTAPSSDTTPESVDARDEQQPTGEAGSDASVPSDPPPSDGDTTDPATAETTVPPPPDGGGEPTHPSTPDDEPAPPDEEPATVPSTTPPETTEPDSDPPSPDIGTTTPETAKPDPAGATVDDHSQDTASDERDIPTPTSAPSTDLPANADVDSSVGVYDVSDWYYEPAHIDFGEVRVGEASDWVEFDLHIGERQGAEGHAIWSAIEFEQLSACSAHSSCRFRIRFVPTGRRSIGPVVFQTRDVSYPDEWITLTATGTGLDDEASFDTENLDFPETVVGERSEPMTATLANTGDFPLDVGGIRIDGPFEIDLTDCDGASLAPGDECATDVTFTPEQEGDASGTVTIETAQLGELQVDLTGTAEDDGAVDLSDWYFEPAHIDFGEVRVGEASDWVEYDLHIGELQEYEVHRTAPELEREQLSRCFPHSSCSYRVRFVPTERGSVTPTIDSADNANTDEFITLTTTGTGLDDEASFDTENLDFPETVVGERSEPMTATLTNTGDFELDITGARVDGPFQPSDDQCAGTSLDPGASCVTQLGFVPDETGDASGAFTLETAQVGDVAVALSGTGVGSPNLVFEPTEVDFGVVTAGDEAERAVTLRNTGNAPAEIDEIDTNDPDEWPIVDTDCPVGDLLAAGDECDIDVGFHPVQSGERLGALGVAYDGRYAEARLSGVSEFANLTFTPRSLDFGDVPVGDTSAPQTLTLRNAGNAPVDIRDCAVVSPTGAFAPDTSACDALPGLRLAPDREVAIGVTFTPQAGRSEEGRVEVATSFGQAQAELHGTGRGIEVSSENLDLGRAIVGHAGAPQQVTITNHASNPVELSIAEPGAAFIMDDGCGGSLAADSTCRITVRFDPDEAGDASGSFTITATHATSWSEEHSVAVSGEGVAATAEMSADPAEVDFGQILAGETSDPTTIEVSNDSNVPLTVDSITADGPFDVVGEDCTGEVAAGATCSVAVVQTPSDGSTLSARSASADALATFAEPAPSGEQTGRLTIEATGSGGDVSLGVALAGYAVTTGITAVITDLDFGTVAAGTSAQEGSITVINTGNVETAITVGVSADRALTIDATSCRDAALAPGATCEIVATFAPATAGTYESTIDIGGTVEVAAGESDVDSITMVLTGVAAAPPPTEPEPDPPVDDPPVEDPPVEEPPVDEPSLEDPPPAKNSHQPQHVATPAAAPRSEEQSLPATGTPLTTTLVVLAAGLAALGALLHFTPTTTRRRRRG